MPTRQRLLFSSLSFVLFFMAAMPLYRELTRPKDIWWTPPTMLVPLTEAQDRVQVYVRGEPVAAPLQSEIGLRFNNWDRMRARQLPIMVTSGAACGGLVVLLIIIATGRLAYRGETGPGA
jgi:hypothetical protein